MTHLPKSKLYEVGKVILKEERSKSFVKQVARVNNQYINLNIINAMIEDDIYINIVDNYIKNSHIQKLRNKSEQLQIRLIIQGKLEKLDQSTNEKVIYNENEISVEYKKNINEALLNKQSEHIKYICITLDEHYLKENSYIRDIFKGNFSKKFYEPNLKSLFLELFNRDYSNKMDKIYLKNRTMQIILYVFEELKKDEIKIEMLNKDDIKRVKKAKIYIQEYFYENITIPLLSKKVALNTTKLKKGFKELFGKTLGEFLRDYRLLKAVEYLKEDIYSVKEVSLKCGYTNQASFSYAFSKKYGIKPKDIQKKSDL